MKMQAFNKRRGLRRSDFSPFTALSEKCSFYAFVFSCFADIASAVMPIGLLIPLIDVIPFHFARLPVCLSLSIYIYE
jgi:hypothetical protein